MQETKKERVVVIGGGLSGLSAGEYIARTRPNVQVVVLEAMNRVGGRTQSVELHGAMFDLGGMWVGSHQKHVLELAARAKEELILQECSGLKILEFANTVGTYPTDIPNNVNIVGLLQMQYCIWKINRMARTVPLKNPSLCKQAAYWDSITVYSWIHENIWFEKVKKLFEAAVRAIFGVEPSEISMLFMLWYVHQSESLENLVNIRNGNQQKKLIFGSQYLSLYLKGQIEKKGGRVELSSPVETVKHTSDSVQVTTKSGAVFQADYLIVAMPPTSINRIHFLPKLSETREMINQKNFMGAIIKILVLYEERFWKNKGFSGQTLSDCIDSPVFNAYDDSRPKGNGELQPAIVVFVNGAVARHWGQKDKLRQRTLEKLAQYFGEKALTPLEIHVQNWSEEEFIRGGPVGNFPPGTLVQVGDISQPEGRIHWAGTESAHEGQGFMDGAIQAGKRAAAEVIRRFEDRDVQLHQPEQSSVPRYFGFITSCRRWFNRFI